MTSLTLARRITPVWPPLLPFEVALGVHALDVLLESHGIDEHQWDEIQRCDSFRRELVSARKEIEETGLSFKRKAAIQAEMYLEDMDGLMADAGVAPSVKLEIFKTLVKCGDLDPTVDKERAQGNGTTFNIQVNF